MPSHLMKLPAPYVTFLENDGPKAYNGWYAPKAKAGYRGLKLRFLVYKPSYPGEPLGLIELLEQRMNGDEDPRYERYLKLMGNPDGALDVFDTVDGVEKRASLKGKVPFASFDGESALVLDSTVAGAPVMQFDEEGKFKKIADSFDAFVASLQKKAPPEEEDE